MCMAKQPDPPKPPPPPAPPPPVLEQAAPIQDSSGSTEMTIRKKAQGTKKYASAATTSVGGAGAGTSNGLA